MIYIVDRARIHSQGQNGNEPQELAPHGVFEAYDLFGNLKMRNNNVNGTVQTVTCLTTGHQDYLVLGLQFGGIQLRSCTTGALLDTLLIQGFTVQRGICQDSRRTVLVSGKMGPGDQSKVIQLLVNNRKITRGQKQLQMPFPLVTGLTSCRHENRKIVFATSPYNVYSAENNTIVAMDFETGAELWHIGGRRSYEGIGIEPSGICTDKEFHLFVADWRSNRILVIDFLGQICGSIKIRCNSSVECVACIPQMTKLIVTDRWNSVYVYNFVAMRPSRRRTR